MRECFVLLATILVLPRLSYPHLPPTPPRPAPVSSSAHATSSICSFAFRQEQTRAVVDYFKVNAFHVLGHGTGAEAALELGRSLGKASPRPPGPEPEAVLSVILASPVLGENELSPDFLEALRTPYIKDGNEVGVGLAAQAEIVWRSAVF